MCTTYGVFISFRLSSLSNEGLLLEAFQTEGSQLFSSGNKELLLGLIYLHRDKLQIEKVRRTASPPR